MATERVDRKTLQRQITEQIQLHQAFDALVASIKGGNTDEIREEKKRFEDKGREYAAARYAKVRKDRKLQYRPKQDIGGMAILAVRSVMDKIVANTLAGEKCDFPLVCSNIKTEFGNQLAHEEPYAFSGRRGRIQPLPHNQTSEDAETEYEIVATPEGGEIEYKIGDPRSLSLDELMIEREQEEEEQQRFLPVVQLWLNEEKRKHFLDKLCNAEAQRKLFEIIGEVLKEITQEEENEEAERKGPKRKDLMGKVYQRYRQECGRPGEPEKKIRDRFDQYKGRLLKTIDEYLQSKDTV